MQLTLRESCLSLLASQVLEAVYRSRDFQYCYMRWSVVLPSCLQRILGKWDQAKFRLMELRESTKMNATGSRQGPLPLTSAAVLQRLSVHG